VSAAAVYQWVKLGHVPRARYAVLLARATLAAGQPVSVDRLAGLGEPHGPEVDTRAGRRVTRAKSRRSVDL